MSNKRKKEVTESTKIDDSQAVEKFLQDGNPKDLRVM